MKRFVQSDCHWRRVREYLRFVSFQIQFLMTLSELFSEQLLAIRGTGPKKAELYGPHVLEVIRSHLKDCQHREYARQASFIKPLLAEQSRHVREHVISL